MLGDQKLNQSRLRLIQSMLFGKAHHLDRAQIRMIATAPFRNIVVQTGDVHQPRFAKLGHHLIGQFVLMQMLLQGKAAQIAHHHQNMLIHRVNVKQIVLHLPDDFTKNRQITPQNPHLMHQTQGVRDAARQFQNT